MQITSSGRGLPRMTLNLRMSCMRMPCPIEHLAKREQDGLNNEKSPLKKFLSSSSRNRSVPIRYGEKYTHNIKRVEVNAPLTYSKATNSSVKRLCLKTTNAEMKTLVEIDMWNLVERPKNKNMIQGKWFFKVKQNEKRKNDKYKAW